MRQRVKEQVQWPSGAVAQWCSERGAVLGLTFIIAVLFSLVAYTNILLAVSQARQADFFRERTGARAAVEAGYTIAKERLWSDPLYCGGTQVIDSNASGVVGDAGDLTVQITVTNCGANNTHQISADVIY